MERVESLRATLFASYRLAIRAAAEYAIELDPQEAWGFAGNLEMLAARLAPADESDSIRQVQDSFEDALRVYQQQAQARVDHLRKEVEAGAAAVATFAGAIASNGSDYQAQMDTELGRLRGMTKSDDLPAIHHGIENVIAGIGDALEHMQRANQMTIAQLRDEIRTLHYSMEAEAPRLRHRPRDRRVEPAEIRAKNSRPAAGNRSVPRAADFRDQFQTDGRPLHRAGGGGHA